MKKISILFILVTFVFTLVACNTTGKKNNEPKEPTELVPIAVEIKTVPEIINPGEEITITATVTQGEEAVEDADEVKFEIKEKGKEENEMIDGNHTSNGVYEIRNTFDHDGVYTVTSHVTARGMHNMPTIELVVGNPESTDKTVSDSGDAHDNSNAHHGHGQVAIKFQVKETYTKGTYSTFIAELDETGSPVVGANVRFEVWKDQTEMHEFIDASEENQGSYKTTYVFDETGVYHIQVHVEKGDIHEHLEKTVTVK